MLSKEQLEAVIKCNGCKDCKAEDICPFYEEPVYIAKTLAKTALELMDKLDKAMDALNKANDAFNTIVWECTNGEMSVDEVTFNKTSEAMAAIEEFKQIHGEEQKK